MSVDLSRCATSHAEVDAFHPGSVLAVPERRAPETAGQRLVRMESEMLDLAIEQHLHRGGQLGELAVSIIALRAEVTG